jgi:hypothetical protein
MTAVVALAVATMQEAQSAAGADRYASPVMDTPAANVRDAKVPLFTINFDSARIYARHPRAKS